MGLIRKRTTLGWLAERRKRGLIRYGALRAGTLVHDQTGELSADRNAWITDFRVLYPCGQLTDDDIALSLAWDARHVPPGPEWPQDGLRLSNEEIARLISSDPDDVQAMRYWLENSHEFTAEFIELATNVIAAYKAAPAGWSISESVMDLVREVRREGVTPQLRSAARALALEFQSHERAS